MADRDRADAIRQQILDLVGEYTKIAHAPAAFVPGESKVPYAGRVYDAHELTNLVDSSLEFWLTAGPWGAKLEKAMRRLFGAPDFLLVNSGSSANLTMVSTLCSPMVARRLEPGDEVITPAVTFPTTLTPIVQNGLIPVFVDCEIGTYNVDPARVEAAIGPRTRAMVIPHTLGNPFDLGRIAALAERHGLWLLEDCCDALGSTWNGRRVGTFGAMASLSFYPAHHMTMGEGGGVVINRGGLTRAAQSIRDWGRDCFPAGTPVICRDGIRPIEAVVAGNEVLTHEGRWRPVLRLTGHRRYTRPMVTVQARLRPPITVSATHPFWVRRLGVRQWTAAGDMRPGDELIARTVPTDTTPLPEVTWSYRTLYKDAVPCTAPVEPDLMRLVGYWMAEGSLARGRRGADGFLAYRVDFSFHERETALVADVKGLMTRYFRCTGWSRHVEHRRALTVSFKSRRAYEFFLQHVGRGARHKRLAPWMLELPDKHISEFLRGYWRGDGSQSDQGFVIHTASAELVEQTRLLLMRLGILASQWKRTPSAHHVATVDGKAIRATGDLHALSIYGLNAERFAEVIGERYAARTTKRQATLDELTGEAFFPVVGVTPFVPTEPIDVYNLEVEQDRSYHAAGVAIHNCWCPPGESNTCGKRFDWQLGDLPQGYDHKYIYSNLGYNLKVTDMQAAVGLAQLDKLADFCARRRANFRRLYDGLQPLADRLVLPRWLPEADPAWFAFPITVTDQGDRRALVQFLESRKIETRMIFAGNVLRQPGFRDIPHRVAGDLTVSDRVMTDTFFVGVYPGLTPAMLDWVVESFVAYFKR
ncbi:MAG: DegT/DnrJ/EryC1/StrS family aminotransferase [Candidatus Rokubacteria bacterium]|nr:DegT/DnrJ/EryC1/StrS family aminotransferase [Candidatus Rokubacteria bacterium]